MTDEKVSNQNSQQLSGEQLQFKLQNEIAQLKKDNAFQSSGRSAKTLVKYPDLRIVLTVLQNGAKIQAHKAEGRISIQPVQGRIKLQLPQNSVELASDDLLTLEKDIVHDVEALEESAFLLTIAWPR